MIELKPCPFCGEPVKYAYNMDLVPYGIICKECHAVFQFLRVTANHRESFGKIQDKIAKEWNRRAR